MLINRDELARKVLEGEITSLDDLNSVLRSMIKDVVETAMGAEMTGFLGYDRYQTPDSDPGNRRNGYSQKELTSKVGSIAIDVPRDRKSEFTPAIVKKRQKDIGGFEELILSMYAKGMSTRDIQHHVKEIYNHDISPETISRITDAVIDKAKEWQNRPLEPVYAIVFMMQPVRDVTNHLAVGMRPMPRQKHSMPKPMERHQLNPGRSQVPRK